MPQHTRIVNFANLLSTVNGWKKRKVIQIPTHTCKDKYGLAEIRLPPDVTLNRRSSKKQKPKITNCARRSDLIAGSQINVISSKISGIFRSNDDT